MSLVVKLPGTVALPMEQIANVRFMILILYGRTHKECTIDAVVVLGPRPMKIWEDMQLLLHPVHVYIASTTVQ